ncbi:MAG: ASCH domain-containing protein [Nitrospirota bacterium]
MIVKKSFRFVLKPEWETAVREGRKTIDVRPNAERYADVKVGDTIHYASTEVTVTGIRAYNGLTDLVHHEDYRNAVPEAKSADEALRKLHGVGLHDIPPHGVLAFEVAFVK